MKRLTTRYPEHELIEKLKQRDESAFDQLYTHYAPALYGILTKIVRDPDAANDLLQDTFVKIWQRVGTYDPDKGRLFTWLLNIARNTGIDHIRHNRFMQAMPVAEQVVQMLENQTEPARFDETLDVADQVRLLDPDQQAVLDLVYFYGFTHTEAAEALNLPLGTVKSRLRAAVQRLRKIYINPLRP